MGIQQKERNAPVHDPIYDTQTQSMGFENGSIKKWRVAVQFYWFGWPSNVDIRTDKQSFHAMPALGVLMSTSRLYYGFGATTYSFHKTEYHQGGMTFHLKKKPKYQ